MRIRKFLLKVHLYGGLICFWYLIILGTSSLNFNHDFSFMQSEGALEEWSRSVKIGNDFRDDLLLSETLRDSLSLIGWPLPWETWHDSTGVFHFALEHPGKRYVIDYTFRDQRAKVQEVSKGYWRIFNSMHGGGAVPNSFFMNAWKWYSRVTVVFVVFSVLSGIYLWLSANCDKKTGWYTLLFSLVVSITWMLQLYFNG